MKNPREKLGNAPIGKLLLSFAVPTVIAGLSNAIYNIVDQIFIGNNVGLLGNAATNVAFPLVTACIAISLLIGVGTSANINLFLGMEKVKQAGQMLGNGILLMVISGIILMSGVLLNLNNLLPILGATPSVMPYAHTYMLITSFGIPFFIFSTAGSFMIRSDGSPRFSMIITMVGVLLNVVLDYVFIFIFNMGMAGAAYATIIAQFITALIVLYYLYNKFQSFVIKKCYFVLKFKVIRTLCLYGIAPCLAQLSMMLLQVVLNRSLTHYGSISEYGSDIPLAVSGIVSKCNYIFMSLTLGVVQSAQPIFGFNFGAKKFARVRKTLLLSCIVVGTINLSAFIIFQCFPHQVVSLFGEGGDMYYKFSKLYLQIFLFMVITNGFQPLCGNFYLSIGKPMYGIFVNLSRRIMIFLPLVLILPMYFGIDGILYAGPIADMVAFIIVFIFIAKAFRDLDKKAKQGNEKVFPKNDEINVLINENV